MKSERRHELEHNELADWTSNAIEKIKPYTNVIVGGTIAVIIFAVGISLWTKQTRLESEAAWNMYYAGLKTNNPEVMKEIADKFPSSDAAQWAIVCEGDMYLRGGCEALFVDKVNANLELKMAIECYKAASDFENPLLGERAAFGLARAYESQGDLKKAKTAYENQLSKWENGIYSKIAKNRLNDIEKKSTKEFYDLFAEYKPETEKTQPSSIIPKYEWTDVPTPEEKFGEEAVVEEVEVEEAVIEEPKVPKIETPKEEPKEE